MENLSLAEPIFLRNLVIYPIKNGSENNRLHHHTIEDLIQNNKGEFRELSVPDVNKIIFDNRGDSPVLMIDGEEITGSMQNRIIAQSSIVEAHTKSNIPVICAEEKRWDEIGGFRTGYCSYPRVRSILASSLHKKIDAQKQIWKEIERKLTVTKTISKTSSMHEIFDNLNNEIERYLEGFETLNHNTVGFIGVAGNQILGCDVFYSPSLYQKFEKKLLRSYALDAIEHQHSKGTRPQVQDFFEKIASAVSGSATTSRSGHRRLKGGKFVGQVVFHNNIPVHLSAFPE
ncbi:MAG: ARPP-1 family domain-containing protein [bacterium]